MRAPGICGVCGSVCGQQRPSRRPPVRRPAATHPTNPAQLRHGAAGTMLAWQPRRPGRDAGSGCRTTPSRGGRRGVLAERDGAGKRLRAALRGAAVSLPQCSILRTLSPISMNRRLSWLASASFHSCSISVIAAVTRCTARDSLQLNLISDSVLNCRRPTLCRWAIFLKSPSKLTRIAALASATAATNGSGLFVTIFSRRRITSCPAASNALPTESGTH
jgi:hypothetical protein